MGMYTTIRPVSDQTIAELHAEPEALIGFLTKEVSNDIGLDKEWDSLDFTLNGRSNATAPLGFIVRGGAPVGEVDVGYGPARTFSSTGVKIIVDALSSVDDESLRARVTIDSFITAEVYPGPQCWKRDFTDQSLHDYQLKAVGWLQEELQGVVEKQQGIVVWCW